MSTAFFARHENFEVAKSLTDSKMIALGQAENHKYKHRAKALLMGNAAVRPFDAVYIDGLQTGLSGYWTVLSVTHVFGLDAVALVKSSKGDIAMSNSRVFFGGGTPYVLEVELGTDVIGDTDSNPGIRGVRNIEAELSDAARVEASNSTLLNVASFLELSTTNTHGETTPTANTTVNMEQPPNFSIIKRAVSWEARYGDDAL